MKSVKIRILEPAHTTRPSNWGAIVPYINRGIWLVEKLHRQDNRVVKAMEK